MNSVPLYDISEIYGERVGEALTFRRKRSLRRLRWGAAVLILATAGIASYFLFRETRPVSRSGSLRRRFRLAA